MMMIRFALGLCIAAVSLAQTPAGRVIGAVTAKDLAARQFTVKADNGDDYTVTFTDATAFLRVPPGETSLAKATKIAAGDVETGDRVMARGEVAESSRKLSGARQIIVMTKSDLAQKHERERAEWQKRGLAGVVASVDAAANTITVTSKAGGGTTTTVVEVSDKTLYRRYAQGSIHWDDAKTGSLAEIKPGDQIRALGQKAANGGRYAAEQVVTGAFLTIAGTVLSVDAAKGEIRLNDVSLKKPVVVTVDPEHTTIRRLPPMLAYGLARRFNPTYQVPDNGASEGMAAPGAGGARQGGAEPGASGAPRTANGDAPAAGAAARPGGGGGGGLRSGPGDGGAPDVSQMVERLPAVQLSDVKPGEALIVYTSEGPDRTRLAGITVLAGAEPILVAAPRTFGQASGIASWNLEMSMPSQ